MRDNRDHDAALIGIAWRISHFNGMSFTDVSEWEGVLCIVLCACVCVGVWLYEKEGASVYVRNWWSAMGKRDHQRYDDTGRRLTTGVIPYRRMGGGEDVEVLLITSMSYPDQWIFPKGGWEDFETAEEGAAREAWEEAGVKGAVDMTLGQYDVVSPSGKKKTYLSMFGLQVNEVLEEYQEKGKRQRAWYPLSKALELTKRNEFIEALQVLQQKLAS